MVIFLDSSDLDWRDDPALLWKQFEVLQFEKEILWSELLNQEMEKEQAVGLSLDMSPHYRGFLQKNYTK